MEATWPDVILDFFRYDKSTLSDLLDWIKRRLGGEKARHVAIVSHSEAGRLYLVGGDEPVINASFRRRNEPFRRDFV